MLQHKISYFFFGVGFAGLFLALIRTYYLFWKLKKERDFKGRRGGKSGSPTQG